MACNKQKDMIFYRDVLLMEPYEFKFQSRDRGKRYCRTRNFQFQRGRIFKVDIRSVRERLDKTIEKFQNKLKG